MRRLSLDQGVVAPARSIVHTASPVRSLRRPSQALRRLERAKAGQQLKINVWRSCGGVGDVLCTLPTVRAIKKIYNCELHYATDFDYLSGALPAVLQGNPYIDKVMDYRELTMDDKEEYDALVDLSCPCTPYEYPGAPPLNRIDIFARHAGVPLTDFTIDYQITREEDEWAQEWINANQLGRYQLVMVQSHSTSARRDLSITKLQKIVAGILVAQRNARGIILTHSTDNSKDRWSQWGTIVTKDFSIRQIAAIMNYCELVICQDSAPLHLAGALHRKSLSFFGPTDPRARIDHFPEAVAVWPGGRLTCGGCWWSPTCKASTPVCWQLIEPEVAIEASLALLNNQSIPNYPELVHFG